MKKKQRQRIKKANKLLVSALMLGALSVPAYAENLNGTLDTINVKSTNIVTNIAAPIQLENTTKPETGEYLTVKIGNTTYYYQGDLPTGFTYKEIQNLVNTGSNALTTTETDKAVFTAGGAAYYYDKAKLPTSSYTATTDGASSTNYNFITYDTSGTPKYWLMTVKNPAGTSHTKWDGTTPSGTVTTSGGVTVNLPNSKTQTLNYNYGSVDYAKNQTRMTSVTSDVTGECFYSITGATNGGAIYNDALTDGYDIIADFISNSAGVGGAIENLGTISSITGDFIGNSVTGNSAHGGAIYNTNNGIITSITGNFISNHAQVFGGAIYNTNNGIITSITGNFINNSSAGNSGSGVVRGAYLGETSGKNYSVQWSQCHKKARLKNPIIEKFVLRKLKLYWAPERIAGRLKYLYKLNISAECIYQYIYDGHRELTKYLPRKHMARKRLWQYRKTKKENIPNRIDIDFRPIEANDRLIFGHFEADCIVSCKGSKSALLVLVDRLTRRTKIKKLERKFAHLASSSIVFALSEYNILHVHSITYDNGCEFAGHEMVNKTLQMKSYFCKPFHSWEKGMVENINGLIRRFLPKGANFDNIADEQIQKIENWINNRSMKILNWKSPNQVYNEFLSSVAL